MSDTPETIRAWVDAAIRLQAVGDAFAAAYTDWRNAGRTRCQVSCTFHAGDVDPVAGTFGLEVWCCGDTEYEPLPLAYLWTPEWIPLEVARIAEENRQRAAAAEAKRVVDRERYKVAEREQYERLYAKFNPTP